jgi:hypothetical protein
LKGVKLRRKIPSNGVSGFGLLLEEAINLLLALARLCLWAALILADQVNRITVEEGVYYQGSPSSQKPWL